MRGLLAIGPPDLRAGGRDVTAAAPKLQRYNREVMALLLAGDELRDELAASPPAFPQPVRDEWARHTENATLTYNFCISPLTPYAVRGVVWIPGPHNIGEGFARYAPAMAAYRGTLAGTYGQARVPFFYAHPGSGLLDGVARPGVANAVRLDFDQWPKSLRDIATELGVLAAKTVK